REYYLGTNRICIKLKALRECYLGTNRICIKLKALREYYLGTNRIYIKLKALREDYLGINRICIKLRGSREHANRWFFCIMMQLMYIHVFVNIICLAGTKYCVNEVFRVDLSM